MSYTTAARNNMLGSIGATHLSAHPAWSTTGTNEVTGGTPAYARYALQPLIKGSGLGMLEFMRDQATQ